MHTVAAILLSTLVWGAAPNSTPASTSASTGELLNFSSIYCGPCQQMAPIVDRLQRNGYPIRKIDTVQNPDLARKYGIGSIPAFVLVINGKPVQHVVGARPEADLLQMLARIPRTEAVPATSNTGNAASSGPTANTPVTLGQKQSVPPPTAPAPKSVAPKSSVPLDSDAPLFTARGPRGAAISAPPELSVAGKGIAGAAKSDVLLTGTKTPAPPKSGLLAWPFQKNTAATAKTVGTTPSTARAKLGDEPRFPAQTEASQPFPASTRIRVTDKSGTNYGSGTIIDSREGLSHVLSCGHVFRNVPEDAMIEVDVYLPGGRRETFVGKRVKVDLEADLSLISIPTDQPLVQARIAPAGTVLQEQDAVTSIGCGTGLDPKIEYHQILTVNRYKGTGNVQCSGNPVQGRSGGGLFSSQKQLIGVCWAQDPHYKCGLYASIDAVHRFLDQCQLSHLYRDPAEETAPDTNSLPEFAENEEPEQSGLSRLRAALGEDLDEEVICVVRSQSRGSAKNRVLVISARQD